MRALAWAPGSTKLPLTDSASARAADAGHPAPRLRVVDLPVHALTEYSNRKKGSNIRQKKTIREYSTDSFHPYRRVQHCLPPNAWRASRSTFPARGYPSAAFNAAHYATSAALVYRAVTCATTLCVTTGSAPSTLPMGGAKGERKVRQRGDGEKQPPSANKNTLRVTSYCASQVT